MLRDLGNEDLVRSHVNAIWLAETDQSMRAKLTDVVDTADRSVEDVVADVLATHPDAEPAARALVDAAVRHGGRDNVTAIVVNVEGEWDTADDDTQPRDRGPATSASDGEER